jgi:nucleotide-binding universal stress UspA family protein
MSTIVIGVDATERSEDAIAFGRRLAIAASAEVIVANAYPYADTPSRASKADYREGLLADALITARQMCSRLDGVPHERAAIHVTADVSPARALQHLALEAHAALLVVGSSHTGRIGRVYPGGTAERLLHGSPCPVAVVPKAYRRYGDKAIDRIGVAYDGSGESRAALAGGAALARALRAELEVIRVITTEYATSPEAVDGKGLTLVRQEVEAEAQRELDDAVAGLGPGVSAHTQRLTGPPAGLLARHSADLDILVMGSRGHGPLHSVLVGGVSGRVLRAAHCPVVVVPRGIERPLEVLFDHSTATAA